jgi:hypothetical protein
MIYNKFIVISICFILILFFKNCTSPSEPFTKDLSVLTEPPIITGIHITTYEQPDGTGEVIGIPSYEIKEISVFPNPYTAFITSVPFPPPHFIKPYITFNHLPEKVKIIIVKGLSIQEALNSKKSLIGASNFSFGINKIRTIEKNNISQFERWYLKDENEKYVSSGYYRVYIFGNNIPENYFLDIELNLTEYDFY